MATALDWLYRRLGPRYFLLNALFEAFSAAVICLGTVGMFSIYVPMSAPTFWEIVAFSEACVMAAFAWAIFQERRGVAPLLDWVRRGGGSEGALEAWQTAVSLPRELVYRAGWQPYAIVSVPISVYFTLRFDLLYYSVAIVFAGALVAIAYAGILSFFGGELFLRPVVRDVVRHLPPDFAATPTGVPLRWKLLGALPLINVITGVVVSGLSTRERASLEDLGLDVVVAVVVAFTISFELTLLVTKSVLTPVRDLLAATERVKGGELSARVPVVSGDELGALASSFNSMLIGLEERERLREAFGSYVDPEVAQRVMAEGTLLEGEEVEATLVFVDMRDFTAFADRASAREAVAHLNGFFGLVVPILHRHGGHANKFIGDGLLAVFGTPEPLPDHADRAVAAACEIADEVERVYASGVRIGVGINSGPVVAGSVGGGGRLEFTVIGDPVNVAARVEKATRELGETVLLTEATRCLLTRAVRLEPRGEAPLRGKSEPVPLYAPVLARPGPDRRPLSAGRRDSRSEPEPTSI